MPASLKAETTRPATIPGSTYVLFLSIAVVGCLADLLSKQAAFAWLGLPSANSTWWLVEGYAGVQTAVNRGALFGIGQGLTAVFATLSIGAGIGILVWLFKYGAAHDRLLVTALGCVMAGIAGNLYDRLGFWHVAATPAEFHYGVRDWILLQWPPDYTWPNFNIADSMLVCGAGLLIWHSLTQTPTTSADCVETGDTN